jgi:gas vesicle protein
MTGMKTAGVIAAVVGLVMLIKERRSTSGLQKALEANWKEIKKKLPDEWSEIAPKKRKEAARFIDSVHKATGESRRRIRRTLQDLTA